MQAPRHIFMMHRWKWKSHSRIYENSHSKRSRKREETREKRDGAYLEGRHGGEKDETCKTIQSFRLGTPHPTVASSQNERPMAKLRQIFEIAAGVDADALLSTPGLTYVVELLRDAGETLCEDDLKRLYAAENWETERSFTWLELEALQHKIQATAVNADLVDAAADTVDSANQHLHPGPAEDSVRAQVIEETTLPRVLAVDEKESPQGLLPACPVDVGGADAEQQARRQKLLGQAIPADLAFAENLIATEYAQFLQNLAAEVRSCMPSSPPEAFRDRRYFSNLEIAVWQREDEEQTERIISHLPVHPQEGVVDPAEKERRVAWIQTLTAEQLQEVDTLVRQKWQLQSASQPVWFSALLPADPTAAFWNAEYYACMAEYVQKLQQQQEVAAVSPAKKRKVADAKSTQPDMTEGQTASGLRNETQTMLLQERSPEGQAPREVEPEPAGVLYGMDAIMDGTAYAEEDITQPVDDSRVSFIGSLRLLLETETGARVHYEGKLVYGDPSPRELPSKVTSGSPGKRSLQNRENKESNSVCDLLLMDKTGPVIITLWGDLVHTWYSTMGNPATPYIRLTNLRVAELPRTEWNGTSVSRMRVLHSTSPTSRAAGTTLSRTAEPTSPYLTQFTYTIPEAPACINQFLSLQSKLRAPFRITLRGIIDDLSDMQLTQQDSKKREFNLVDSAGMWLRCCALGRCAQSRCLENGNEVILYYGTGRSARGSSPAMVYLMKDSLIVQTACSQRNPTKRAEIHIDGA